MAEASDFIEVRDIDEAAAELVDMRDRPSERLAAHMRALADAFAQLDIVADPAGTLLPARHFSTPPPRPRAMPSPAQAARANVAGRRSRSWQHRRGLMRSRYWSTWLPSPAAKCLPAEMRLPVWLHSPPQTQRPAPPSSLTTPCPPPHQASQPSSPLSSTPSPSPCPTVPTAVTGPPRVYADLYRTDGSVSPASPRPAPPSCAPRGKPRSATSPSCAPTATWPTTPCSAPTSASPPSPPDPAGAALRASAARASCRGTGPPLSTGAAFCLPTSPSACWTAPSSLSTPTSSAAPTSHGSSRRSPRSSWPRISWARTGTRAPVRRVPRHRAARTH